MFFCPWAKRLRINWRNSVKSSPRVILPLISTTVTESTRRVFAFMLTMLLLKQVSFWNSCVLPGLLLSPALRGFPREIHPQKSGSKKYRGPIPSTGFPPPEGSGYGSDQSLFPDRGCEFPTGQDRSENAAALACWRRSCCRDARR